MKKNIIAIAFAGALFCASGLTAATVQEKAKNALKQMPPDKIVLTGDHGALYLKSEVEHLAAGPLTDGKVAAAAKSSNRRNADPMPAMKAFHDSLAKLGIRLIVVPVPPKLAGMPSFGMDKGEAAGYLREYYAQLRKSGLDVLDLSEDFAKAAIPAYCRDDSHWNPEGIRIAAEKIAAKAGVAGNSNFTGKSEKIKFAGDLKVMLQPGSAPAEETTIRRIQGKTLDESSPILVIGDSHTLVFHAGKDMLAENAGLVDLLAEKLKMPIDLLAVRGSGATPVRVDLYRKGARNAAWLKNKKCVIWVFAAREFTESPNGFAKVPVLKK